VLGQSALVDDSHNVQGKGVQSCEVTVIIDTKLLENFG